MLSIKKSNVNIEEILNKTVKFTDDNEKQLVTFAAVSLVNLATKIPLDKILNFEKNINNNLKNINLLTGNFDSPNIFTLGVGATINARILICILTKVLPSLKSAFEGEYGEQKAKKIEKAMVVILSIMNGMIVSFNIFNGSLLLGLILAIGSCLLNEVVNYLDKKGICDGVSTMISFNAAVNILNNFNAQNIIVGLIGIPIAGILFSKLQKSKFEIEVQKNDKAEAKIPIKIFKNGVFPLFIANSVFSILSMYLLPGIKGLDNISSFIIQSVLIAGTNMFMSNQLSDEDLEQKIKGSQFYLKDDAKSFKEKFKVTKEVKSQMKRAECIESAFLISLNIVAKVIPGGDCLFNIYIISGFINQYKEKTKAFRNVKNIKGFLI